MICFLGVYATPARALTPTPTVNPATTPTPCPDCGRLGYLSVSSPTVNPPMPTVGDVVTFTFPLNYALPGSITCSGFGGGSCQFEEDGSLFDGNDPATRTGDAIEVRRRAVRAGGTLIRLTVTTMTEEACYYPDPSLGCQLYYQYVSIEASSPVLGLQVNEATTPMPTHTATPTPTGAPPPCLGDCDGVPPVTADDLLTLVNIALGNATVSTCLAGDANRDGAITIDEILAAVRNALDGCGAE
jgi:hypothetical protein